MRRSRAAGARALTLHTTDMMEVAMALYERMGFARAAELDFRPGPTMLVKGYRLEL
jgi:ribosomal protein S18 acetylase RimI-like enzyme